MTTRQPTSPASSDDWVGIPWRAGGSDRSGCDCWGLVRLWYRERRGVELPAADDAVAAAVHDAETASARWEQVERDRMRVGDLLLMRMPGGRVHVGLVWPDAAHMLHILDRMPSRVEAIAGSPWAALITGVWRWRG
ncbi:MAG TPA: hypothetical protein ENK53_03430 [Thiotrichales bacterium]|nr:hypothetical protein [Thiotrichales bacterium]